MMTATVSQVEYSIIKWILHVSVYVSRFHRAWSVLMGKRLHREMQRVSKTASAHSFFMSTEGLCWNYIKHYCSRFSHWLALWASHRKCMGMRDKSTNSELKPVCMWIKLRRGCISANLGKVSSAGKTVNVLFMLYYNTWWCILIQKWY